MTDRMTAAQLVAHTNAQHRAKRVDHEGPIHRAILAMLDRLLPDDAVVHHSPNEVDMQGPKVAKAIAKARVLGTVKGWPDIEIIWRGRAYFIEVKAPKGTVQDSQARCHAILAVAGCPVIIARSADEAEAALRDLGVIPIAVHAAIERGDSDNLRPFRSIGGLSGDLVAQAVSKQRLAE